MVLSELRESKEPRLLREFLVFIISASFGVLAIQIAMRLIR